MNFIWLLVGIPVVAIIFSAREIVRDWRHRLPERVVPLNPVRFPLVDAVPPPAMPKRPIKWISMKDCEGVVHNSSNVVFIEIRSGSEGKPLPFPATHVLSIAPSQLVDVLRWLPPDSCVVLWGEVDLCSSILGSLDDVAGSASIYVFKGEPAHSEVGRM
jgi:hypothetical protein